MGKKVLSIINDVKTFRVFLLSAIIVVIFFPSFSEVYKLVFSTLILTGISVSVGVVIISDTKERLSFRKERYDIIYSNIECAWRISENGDFYAKNLYTLKNIGDRETCHIPSENALWFKKPREKDFEIKVHDDLNGKFKIIKNNPSIYDTIVGLIFGKKAHYVSWSHRFVPPLQHNEEFSYEFSAKTLGTELDAFTDEGTYLGIPANIPIEKASINCFAPEGYKFEILNPVIVVDVKTLEKLPNKEKGIKGPQLDGSGTIISWKLKKLSPGCRYWVKYRFKK